MRLLSLNLFFLSIGIATGLDAPALDVTDLLSWPPCSQNCIPLGFGPPADCGSLANRTCICKSQAFSDQIGSCQIATCGAEERKRIAQLTPELCDPVGGYNTTTIAPALSSYLATAAPYPTATPGLDPANILSYPKCAQICANETAAPENTPCDPTLQECRCGADFRADTAACEKITCSGNDYNRTQQLAEELCAPLYSSSALLGPSVTSAMSSSTSFAASAVASRDPIDPKTWPACGQACLAQYLPQSGCNGLADRKCACQTSNLSKVTGPCYEANCSTNDYRIIVALSLELCNPIGGVGNGSNASITAALASPTAFAGGAIAESPSGWIQLWAGMVSVGLVTLLCV